MNMQIPATLLKKYSESLVFKTYPWGVIHSLDMAVFFT